MSRETTEALIRQFIDALNRGDAGAVLALVTDDLVHDVNMGERRIGRDKFQAFTARMAHCYAEQLDGATILVSGDGARAAAEFMIRGRYKNTDEGLPVAHGQSYALPGGSFFAIRDGRIARVTAYFNLTDWLVQIAPEIALG